MSTFADAAPLDERITGEMLCFLLTKTPPRLIGPTCQSDQRACARPVWGDGRLNGSWFGLCSRCLHQHLAFHSPYTTLQANPAAAKLDGTGIQRLTFADEHGTLTGIDPAAWKNLPGWPAND